MRLAINMKPLVILCLLIILLPVFFTGCAATYPTDCNSIEVGGMLCSVVEAPLSCNNLSKCQDLKGLKKGTASEIVTFQYYLPIATVGNVTMKKAMDNGDITEVYYADYSYKYFLIVGFLTVNVYGR